MYHQQAKDFRRDGKSGLFDPAALGFSCMKSSLGGDPVTGPRPLSQPPGKAPPLTNSDEPISFVT